MTWANQVRVLKQQFQALGAVIGQGLIQALKPALIAFNAFLSRVIEFAKQVLNALGKIFGWKVDISGGGLDTDLEEAEDAASGLGDALGGASDNAGDAADNVKELKKQLQGFDKLNVLTTTDTGSGSGGSGGSGGGSGGSGSGGGSGATNDLAVNLEKTEGLFESSINNLYDLGAMISKTLQDTLDGIPWDTIYHKADNFGIGLADFLNGLFSGTPTKNAFASLGRTVAGAINTALHFLDSFAEEFDFSTFGTNFASFFVEAVKNIDWTLAGKAFHDWMQGIKEAFNSFVSYLWENKDEVWKAIKDFLSEVTIEDIAIFIGIMTISKIGKWILAEGVLSLAGQAIGALFKGVGIAIAAKITGLSLAEAGATSASELVPMIISALGGMGAVLSVTLPIAALAILSVVAWRVAEKDYSEYEDANAAVRRLVTAGVDGEELKTTVAWKVKHELDTENQGAFVNDTFGSMFTEYHLDENGNLEYDMNGFVHVDWDVKLNWIKDKWQSLKDWLKEKWSDITGGLGGSKWSETWSATVSDVTIRFKVGIGWIKDKWKSFKEWLKENLFSSNDNAKYNSDGTITTASVINSNFHVKLGEMIKDGWTTLYEWITNKIYGNDKNHKTGNIPATSDVKSKLGSLIKDGWSYLYKWLIDKIYGNDKTHKTGNIPATSDVKSALGYLIKDGWTTFSAWLKEKIFGSGDSGTTDLGNRTASIAKIVLALATPFTGFLAWIKEKIFGKDDDGTTDLGDRKVSIGNITVDSKSGLTSSGGGLGGLVINATANLTTWYRDKKWINGGASMNAINFWANLYTWHRDKKWQNGGKTYNSIDFWANLYTWYRDKKWLNGGNSWNSISFKAKLWDWFRTNQWINGGDAWNSIAFKARLTSYSLGSAVKNAVIDVAARVTGKESGGVLTASGWKPIQGFAGGGLPSYGQVFIAREAGPELVGNLGGHTAVMNNDQIVASVANGVAQAVSGQNALLAQQNELLKQILAKETGISSRDIFDAVRSENRNYTNRTGKSAFSF